jgi:hypothetical protein
MRSIWSCDLGGVWSKFCQCTFWGDNEGR